MVKLYIYLGTFLKLELTWKNAIRVSDLVAAVVHLLYRWTVFVSLQMA